MMASSLMGGGVAILLLIVRGETDPIKLISSIGIALICAGIFGFFDKKT